MDFIHSSETDIAYYLLSEKGQPRFFKDLIMDIIDKKCKPVQSMAESIAEVYTLLNMDARFHHFGDGMWGLTEWMPTDTKRSVSSSSGSGRAKSSNSSRRTSLLESIQDDSVE